MEFIIATRALIGFRNEFLTMTRGTGIMYQNFYQYQKYKGEMPQRNNGVQISHASGQGGGVCAVGAPGARRDLHPPRRRPSTRA